MQLINSKRLVLTGGPCAGKTSISAVLAHAFDGKVALVPEAASLVFRGGFPRWREKACQEATQKAIFHVQQNMENSFGNHFPQKLLILDRGTVDGAAYWPKGTDDFFASMNSTLDQELSRYCRVIYLESADKSEYEVNKQRNPIRIEDWEEAKRLDEETYKLWSRHPKLDLIPNQKSFSDKIFAVLKIVESELSF